MTVATPLVLDLAFLPPGRMTAPRIIGSTVEGGASLSGITLASDANGGGLVAVDYQNIQLSNTNRDRILFFNRLMIALQGGIRQCVVPLLTDYIAPCADSLFVNAFTSVPQGYSHTPFSDLTTFSDGSEFSQANVSGLIVSSGNSGDGTVTLSVINGRQLQGGEWFGVQHASGAFRAYCVTDIDSQSVDGTSGIVTATVAIRPTLREAITVGMNVDWWRPRCTMRIKSGMDPTLDLSQFWYGTPSLSFVEAF